MTVYLSVLMTNKEGWHRDHKRLHTYIPTVILNVINAKRAVRTIPWTWLPHKMYYFQNV